MYKSVGEFNHEIGWEKTICLEKEKRLFPRKILESVYYKIIIRSLAQIMSLFSINKSVYIKGNKERCMNLNEGIGVNMIYGRGKNIWIKWNTSKNYNYI